MPGEPLGRHDDDLHHALGDFLDSIERNGRYRVDRVLKRSEHETTRLVYRVGPDGTETGPYVHKLIDWDSGLGRIYEDLFLSCSAGRRFRRIPTIYEFDRIGDVLSVVMEYVDGPTLKELIVARGPSLELAVQVFPGICEAASELHSAFAYPIIHRDLKPSNIIFPKSDPDSIDLSAPKLIDFGTARAYRSEARHDTVMFGTRSYAPPEQYGFGQTDVKSDVFALGMILSFCLTGRDPVSELRESGFDDPAIPQSLRPVLVKATSLDPADRYTDALALGAAFEAVALENSSSPDPIRTRPQLEPESAAPSRSAPRKSYYPFPEGVGRVLNFFVIFLWAFVAVVAILGFAGILQSSDASGTESIESMPGWLRVIVPLGMWVFGTAPVAYLLLDKRRLRRRLPKLATRSLLSEIAICLILWIGIWFITAVVYGLGAMVV